MSGSGFSDCSIHIVEDNINRLLDLIQRWSYLPNPLPLNISMHNYSPHCSLYISQGADQENLFNNQKLLSLMIILFILITLTCDLVVIL